MPPEEASRPRLPKRPLRRLPHALRVVLLMTFAAGWLAWLVSHTEILFPDGLRYVEQARAFDRGAWSDAVRHAVDHPIYPLGIVTTHRLLRLDGGPEGWQLAAQITAAVAGMLLVVPLYLVARELFGGASATLGCMLLFLVPLPAHVFADALSESTFLLFWNWGVWASLRYLRAADVGWLIPALGFGALAYLTRPEGLLLPPALIATLVLSPLLRSARLPARRWRVSVVVLIVGPLTLVGPYVAAKGGLGTKPAVARLLGLSGPSKPDAVERERPLPANLGTFTTYRMALSAALIAVCGAVTFPLLPFSLAGIVTAFRRTSPARMRGWLFLAVVSGASLPALTRLYATGGYCTPRHTFLISLTVLTAAGAGMRWAVAAWLRSTRSRIWRRRATFVPPALMIGLACLNFTSLIAPVNAGMGAYRDAGLWAAEHVPRGEKIVDVTGWSQFYGRRSGYTFANLIEAPGDPSARWVFVRDAHLYGPWKYCERLQALIDGSRLVARFPEVREPGRSRVSVYERPAARRGAAQ